MEEEKESREQRAFIEHLMQQIDEDLKRYADLAMATVSRTRKLIETAFQSPSEIADDIFRAVVVLTHAHLEDFLRTVGTIFLPNADECTLNTVPLAALGNKGRAEKFSLGELAKHRNKTVDEVIKESVSEYLGKRSFNKVTEIISFLKSLGFQLSEEDWKSNSAGWPGSKGSASPHASLDRMIERRHQIVHRADRTTGGHSLQAIDGLEVMGWMKTTVNFMGVVTERCLAKQRTPEAILKKYGEFVGKARPD